MFGSIRGSTAAQDLTTQRAELALASCDEIVYETTIGAHAERPKARELLAGLHPGDMVVTPAVGRILRDRADLLVIARQMKDSGARLRSLRGPFLETTSNSAKIVLAFLGVAEKLERRLLTKRTKRGRATAKAQGVRFGRKPKLTLHRQREAAAPVAAGEPQRAVTRRFNVGQFTIDRLPLTEAAHG